MSWSSTSDECKECSLEKLNKEAYEEKSQGFEAYQKRPLYADRRRQLGGESPMHNRSVVKTFYNRDTVSEWLFRSSG